MSDDQKEKNLFKRWIGKIKNIQTQYGIMQKIYMENADHLNKDGTPNPYYKGTMVWYDADGTPYKVKQMAIHVPRNGMPQDQAQRGFAAYITLTLNDEYEVQIMK